MKKSTIIVIVVIVLIAIWGITSYNGMVKMDESVSTAWSNVENQYQRRSDLIPNLVNTVKGYASHEKETFHGEEQLEQIFWCVYHCQTRNWDHS